MRLRTPQLYTGETKPPLGKFRQWANRSNPNELDKPTRQEVILITAAFVFAPIVIAYASVWILFDPSFREMPFRKRALETLYMPFLLPPAYFYVVVADFLLPMCRRIRARARALREADRAVKELIRGAV